VIAAPIKIRLPSAVRRVPSGRGSSAVSSRTARRRTHMPTMPWSIARGIPEIRGSDAESKWPRSQTRWRAWAGGHNGPAVSIAGEASAAAWPGSGRAGRTSRRVVALPSAALSRFTRNMYTPLTQFETLSRISRDELALLHAVEADRPRKAHRHRLSPSLPRLSSKVAPGSRALRLRSQLLGLGTWRAAIAPHRVAVSPPGPAAE
jgi:hypothetical protein